eukprot:1772896-Rhodomonas_salina.2
MAHVRVFSAGGPWGESAAVRDGRGEREDLSGVCARNPVGVGRAGAVRGGVVDLRAPLCHPRAQEPRLPAPHGRSRVCAAATLCAGVCLHS